MSGIGSVIPGLVPGLIGDFVTLLTRTPRRIDNIVADVTLDETHVDELTITQHPVEQGATITDHAFKNPARLVVRAGFTDSSLSNLISQATTSDSLGSFLSTSYAQTVYDKFLALQASRKPFTVVTGKRSYKNMLVASLAIRTDVDTEYALMAIVTLQEVILVSTQTATLPEDSSQAAPDRTGNVQDRGDVQPTPAPNYNPGSNPG